MEGPFPEYIEFFSEHGVLLRQQVVFEWKPSKCTHCGMYGHIEEDYRKKHHEKEWRRVQAPPQETAVNNDVPMPATSEEEGFTAVTRRTAAKSPQHVLTTTNQNHNNQLIHGKALQLSTNKLFYVTVIYGMNHVTQRQVLWDELIDLAPHSEAWCILGDFNAVLSKEDRIKGDPMTEQEIQELKPLLETCELQESPSVGAYFTWTNKTIWSRLGRILLNPYWHATFDYTHTKTLAMGLSDHTPLLLQFVRTPRPRPCFQYCEMWSKQPEFLKIVEAYLPSQSNITLAGLYSYLDLIRPQLQRLNTHKFADLQGQQLKVRKALEEIQRALQQQPGDQHLLSLERQVKEHYISILASSLFLIKQQSKMEWLNFGDENTRLFFAKSKQRKMATYIYSLKDASGTSVHGFDAIG
ncbi:hypothetical protein Cgig2_003298 [Carnegiea gigantea]|uniref:Reverse transcriptase n=1 Tax=Carnegiea gigantea TaxID=171969 RepID=A0A9Q1GFC4_9CARY|nr:hypothetical protein Cgig2_003298 [Carnegiea gigantea]